MKREMNLCPFGDADCWPWNLRCATYCRERLHHATQPAIRFRDPAAVHDLELQLELAIAKSSGGAAIVVGGDAIRRARIGFGGKLRVRKSAEGNEEPAKQYSRWSIHGALGSEEFLRRPNMWQLAIQAIPTSVSMRLRVSQLGQSVRERNHRRSITLAVFEQRLAQLLPLLWMNCRSTQNYPRELH